MHLSIQKLSKRFNQRTIFRNLTFSIDTGARFAVTGPNGSGKSTLIKILSGGTLPTAGEIRYEHSGRVISTEDIYRYVHFVAPYNTVIEELTLPELFTMHRRLGLLRQWESYDAWMKQLDYPFPKGLQIRSFSSGMKQRVKLGLALLDDRPLVFLDEPGSNLDAHGKMWMYGLIQAWPADRTLVIASNDQEEISWCSKHISLEKKS